MTIERKVDFLQLLQSDCLYKIERSPIMVAMEYVTANLAKCFEGTSKKLYYPELPENGNTSTMLVFFNMLQQDRLNEYRIMWLFVFFDLPVETKKERKAAADFRKNLMKDGFAMMQFSVYTRHCASDESAQVHMKRAKATTPEKGQVSILKVTDKQYGDIINIWGAKEKPLPPGPTQMEMF